MDSKLMYLMFDSWTEFKIPLKKKRSYATILVRMIYKYLNDKLIFDHNALSTDE